jgi:hypothetical protein
MSQLYRFIHDQKISLPPSFLMLLISLGLHSLLLSLPIPSEPKLDTAEIEKVKITEIPSTDAIASFPKPSDQSALPPQVPIEKNPLVLENALPKQEIKQEFKQELKTPTPSPTVSPDPKPTTKSQVPDTKVPFTDFPKYPNAEAGSFGLLQGEENLASQQTPDSQNLVASYFERELPARGYELRSHISEPKRKVYQIFKGGMTKFLNIISRSGRGTVIVLSSKTLDIENLQAAAIASKAETEFDLVLTQLNQLGATRIAIPEFYFAQPEMFYARTSKDSNSYDIDKPRSGFDGNFVVILDKSPERVFSTFFAPNFQNRKFEVSPMSNYGGGLVYKVKQSSFVRYLNLLPTQSGVGTIVVIWRVLPF